jgi:sugar lactone lactonase YvrE
MADILIDIREYNGYLIKYNQTRQIFEAYRENEPQLKANKESDLAIKIDNSVKRRAKTKETKFPINVYYNTYDELENCKITSVADDGSIWITRTTAREPNKREKLESYTQHKLYPVNEKTTSVKNQVDEINKTITALSTQRITLIHSIGSPINVKELKGEE